MKNTQKIAVGGLLTAFASVIVILSNLIPAGNFTFPAAAGVVIYILSFTAGKSVGWTSFAAVSVIGFLLCTNKEAAVCFLFLFGYYPMVKELIEKLRLRVVVYILKLLLFNAAAIAIYFLLILVFSVPADQFEFFGLNLPLLFLGLLNVVFLIYDYALTVFDRTYRNKINKFVTKLIKKL